MTKRSLFILLPFVLKGKTGQIHRKFTAEVSATRWGADMDFFSNKKHVNYDILFFQIKWEERIRNSAQLFAGNVEMSITEMRAWEHFHFMSHFRLICLFTFQMMKLAIALQYTLTQTYNHSLLFIYSHKYLYMNMTFQSPLFEKLCDIYAISVSRSVWEGFIFSCCTQSFLTQPSEGEYQMLLLQGMTL